MPEKPETLEDALVALARLEKVVDRVRARLDKLADEDVRPIKDAVDALRQQARETEITADWTLGRTDELGTEKATAKQVQGEFRRLNPPQVERIRERGKVRTRLKRA